MARIPIRISAGPSVRHLLFCGLADGFTLLGPDFEVVCRLASDSFSAAERPSAESIHFCAASGLVRCQLRTVIIKRPFLESLAGSVEAQRVAPSGSRAAFRPAKESTAASLAALGGSLSNQPATASKSRVDHSRVIPAYADSLASPSGSVSAHATA